MYEGSDVVAGGGANTAEGKGRNDLFRRRNHVHRLTVVRRACDVSIESGGRRVQAV